MFKTKIVELFYAMLRSEQRRFCRWLDSPFYNSRADVRDLGAYLYEKAFKQRSLLDKKLVFKYLYNNADFNERQLYYTASYLLQQLEAFLSATADEQPERDALQLAKAYRRLGQAAQARKTLDGLRRRLEQQPQRDTRYHGHCYQVELEEYAFHTQTERHAPRNLQALSDALDRQFISEKLKQACLLLAHQAVYKTPYETGLLDLLLAYLQGQPQLLDLPAIGLYYYYYQTIQQPATAADTFQHFKRLLQASAGQFVQEESRDLYILAINYLARKFNTENARGYLEEIWELYKSALQTGSLLEQGRMSPFTFKNIAGTAMRLGELPWARAFIEQYQALLPEADRETYVHYALSKWAFSRKDYDEALRLLQKVEYSDLFLNLDTKVMLLKIYYERGAYEALESLLKSFSTFLQRKKQLGYHRENYQNMIRLTQKLVSLPPLARLERSSLREEIRQTAALGERDWLLEMVELLNG